MELVVLDTAEEAQRLAAARIAATVRSRRSAVLGLATGRTMEGVYAALAAMHRAGRLSLAGISTFNLDEYCGLGPEDPCSYRATMERLLFARVDVARSRTHLPDGTAVDPEAEARRYEAAIQAAGGIDLQLLGIGRNGHIGFNEPGSPAESRTRLVRLSPATRTDNQSLFPAGRAVPRTAITMGIATISEARCILLLATGAAKAAALRAALHGPVTPACPASLLRGHPRIAVVGDRDAMGQADRG